LDITRIDVEILSRMFKFLGLDSKGEVENRLKQQQSRAKIPTHKKKEFGLATIREKDNEQETRSPFMNTNE